MKVSRWSNRIVVLLSSNVHLSHFTYYIVRLIIFLRRSMKDLNQITRELFVSVDEACHALDEMTLPEGYVTTIKRKQMLRIHKDGDVKAVNLQYSCNDRQQISESKFRSSASSSAHELMPHLWLIVLGHSHTRHRRCGHCGQQEYSAMTCSQLEQIQAALAAPPAVISTISTPFKHLLDAVNAELTSNVWYRWRWSLTTYRLHLLRCHHKVIEIVFESLSHNFSKLSRTQAQPEGGQHDWWNFHRTYRALQIEITCFMCGVKVH